MSAMRNLFAEKSLRNLFFYKAENVTLFKKKNTSLFKN